MMVGNDSMNQFVNKFSLFSFSAHAEKGYYSGIELFLCTMSYEEFSLKKDLT
jgi:hypothetical protein